MVNAPKTIEMEPGLDAMQQIVGGLIECVRIPELATHGIDLWVNEEGKILGLPANFTIADVGMVVGTAFFASCDDEGKTVGLSPAQEEVVRKFLATAPQSVF